MRSLFRAVAAVLVVLIIASAFVLSPVHAGKKKAAISTTVHAGLLVDVSELTVTPAQKNCENWSWAAAVESALRVQGVNLDQVYWIDRVSGGRCEQHAPSVDDTVRLVSGDYTTQDGQSFHLKATSITGPPIVVDGLLMSLKRGHPALLFWRSHPYILSGAVYDEAIYPTGNKILEIRELQLRDTLKPQDDGVKFVRDKDDANEIDGVVMIEATRP